MPRVFLISRIGDGTSVETAFRADVPPGVTWQGYTVGTKFLVATESDLSSVATELTSATAVSMAASLYGITVDHLDFTPGDPVSFMTACQQVLSVAAHAPVALLFRAAAAVKGALNL